MYTETNASLSHFRQLTARLTVLLLSVALPGSIGSIAADTPDLTVQGILYRLNTDAPPSLNGDMGRLLSICTAFLSMAGTGDIS